MDLSTSKSSSLLPQYAPPATPHQYPYTDTPNSLLPTTRPSHPGSLTLNIGRGCFIYSGTIKYPSAKTFANILYAIAAIYALVSLIRVPWTDNMYVIPNCFRRNI